MMSEEAFALRILYPLLLPIKITSTTTITITIREEVKDGSSIHREKHL
jgi:hypothetical protein